MEDLEDDMQENDTPFVSCQVLCNDTFRVT